MYCCTPKVLYNHLCGGGGVIEPIKWMGIIRRPWLTMGQRWEFVQDTGVIPLLFTTAWCLLLYTHYPVHLSNHQAVGSKLKESTHCSIPNIYIYAFSRPSILIYILKKIVAWMHCKSLWIKASAKCINVNVTLKSQSCRLRFVLLSKDRLLKKIIIKHHSCS